MIIELITSDGDFLMSEGDFVMSMGDFVHLAFHHQSLATEEVVEEIFLPE